MPARRAGTYASIIYVQVADYSSKVHMLDLVAVNS